MNSLKRAFDFFDNALDAPVRKRQKIEFRTLRSAIRDAPNPLIEAIKEAEIAEEKLRQAKEAARQALDATQSQPKKPTPPEPLQNVWLVWEESFYEHKSTGCTVVGAFSTLEDANHRLRNLCQKYADRDDPEANFLEGYNVAGSIWWKFRDHEGWGMDMKIEKMSLCRAGSEPTKDWGRPIGEPCSSEDDSETE